MSHLAHETLWALGRGELPQAQADDARAHLALCADCQRAFTEVQDALSVLSVLPEAPPMPEAMARRVGARLAEEMDLRAAKSLRSWWATLFTPRLVLVGALGVLLAVVAAYVVTRPAPEGPSPIATPTPPQPTPDLPGPGPQVAPPPVPDLPKPAPKKLTATVASAKKARAASQQAAKAQVLAEGAVVKTEKGGSLWLKLPDGTRAGLTGQSQVTLATLEEKALTLDVAGGSLAMVVPHREDRVLTVRAGEVEVKDLGTRFLVSREVNRVLVAVEEGSVEVKTPTSTETVRAGRAVSWRDGKLSSMPWAVKAEAPARAGSGEAGTAARLGGDDGEADEAQPTAEDEPLDEPIADTPPVAPPEYGDPDEQWATPPGLSGQPGQATPPPDVNAPPPPPAQVDTAHPPAAGPPAPRRRGGFNLGELEKRIREFSREVQKPFLKLDPKSRARAAVEVTRLANQGLCEEAVAVADDWLADTNRATDAEATRRGVLQQKVRCLTALGRTAEAAEVQRQLDE